MSKVCFITGFNLDKYLINAMLFIAQHMSHEYVVEGMYSMCVLTVPMYWLTTEVDGRPAEEEM
jgi:hypothetical protein